MGYEEMRLTFKPSAIKILMIADAPPMPDTHFFYDQASSDSLRDFTIEAFANAKLISPSIDASEFLKFYKDSGFYLDDLSLISLHEAKKMKDPDLIHEIRAKGKALLYKRVQQYQSESPLVAIISVAKEIKQYIDDALYQAKLPSSVQTYNIAFPSPEWTRNQAMYVDSLTQILLELKRKRLL